MWDTIKRHSLLPALLVITLGLCLVTVFTSHYVENQSAKTHNEKPTEFWSYEHRMHVADRLAPESAAEVAGMALLVVLLVAKFQEAKAQRNQEKGEAGGAGG